MDVDWLKLWSLATFFLEVALSPRGVHRPNTVCEMNCWYFVDSIAVSLFVDDILVELTNTDGKIQITILILRRGALSSILGRSVVSVVAIC